MKPALPIAPVRGERPTLEQWSQDPSVHPRLRLRARIILKAEQGKTNQLIARELGVTATTVGLWRRRFAVHGLEGIRLRAPHLVRSSPSDPGTAERILRVTREVPPPDRLRWTTRTLARYLGLNHMQVYRVWKEYSVFSGPPTPGARSATVGPWVDMLGTFQCPPVRAIVFGIDDAGKPHHSGSRESATDDPLGARPKVIYVPSPGTHDLAWTLEELREVVPERRVSVASPHDLLIFLRSIERRHTPGLRRHLIVSCPDDDSRNRLRHWLARRPRFASEIVANPSDWQTAVDRFLRKWGTQQLAPASFRSISQFMTALVRVAADSTSPPVAFTWNGP